MPRIIIYVHVNAILDFPIPHRKCLSDVPIRMCMSTSDSMVVLLSFFVEIPTQRESTHANVQLSLK